jgi:signal transduction histidine kinase/ActR/RegA family two-component response regulator
MPVDALTALGNAFGWPWIVERHGQVEYGNLLFTPEENATVAALLGELVGHDRANLFIARCRDRATFEPHDNHSVVGVPIPNGLFVIVAPHRGATARSADDDERAHAAAHELANALGVILGWSSLARRAATEAQREHALERIEESARLAHATARELLASDSIPPPHEGQSLDLASIVRDVALAIAPQAESASVELETRIAHGVHVRASRSTVYSALFNLAKNAVEASPPGGSVRLCLERDGDHARFSVDDSGPGISPALRARVFDAYYTTKHGGTGLGLAVVRRALAASRATISVDASSLGGARMTATFEVLSPTEGRSSGIGLRIQLADAKILVVDDDTSMRELITTALGLAGATVVAVRDADEVSALEGSFDAALVDWSLSDRSGERRGRGDSVIATIRAKNLARRIAVVSGSSPPSDIDPASRPDTWLRKPFEIEDLTRAVGALLSSTNATWSGRAE